MGKNRGSMSVMLLCILVWISAYGQEFSAEVLSKNIFFLAESRENVTVPVSPVVQQGTEHQYQWIWTSHDGRHSNTTIAKIISSTWEPVSKTLGFSKGSGYGLSMTANFGNAGELVFMQTKPTSVIVTRFQVFAFKVTPYEWPSFHLGSDVSFSCELSRLPEGTTLQWEREGDPISNTTLFYNNTIHMVIHSVDQSSKGRCNCALRQNGTLLYEVYNVLNVQTRTFNMPVTLFRESSNSSVVEMMCRSSSWHRKASWTKGTSQVEAPTTLTSDDRLEIDRFSSPKFNNKYFPLRLSPVTFEDGGVFRCHFNNNLMSYVQLTTIQVSASVGPPGGQSVVLKCEVSEVSGDPVTLAWLKMEGRTGLVVKQDILTESQPNWTLSVTLPSLHRDQLDWQCVVFREGMLRASVPLRLRVAGGRSGLPDLVLPSPLKDYTLQISIIVPCTALVVAGILIGALVFYLKRKKTDPAVTSLPLTQKNDPVYGNITDPQADQESQGGQDGNEEVHYSEVALGEPRLGGE
uniref:Ig-like domain-containing protein n=1 Tax=Hucho hucho TaxID=62062 RepID=A0A4W5N944_9TELE